jgi:hypothetical protein
MFVIFAMTGVAFAKNRVEVNVNSEPIKYHATCDKGGGFTMQFDAGTILTHGDQITIDMQYVNSSQNVTLCRDIDIVISPNDDGAGVLLDGSNGGGWSIAANDVTTLAPPAAVLTNLTTTDAPVIYSSSQPATTDGGIFFHIYGTAGNSRITIDVLGEDQSDIDGDGVSTLTVPDADPDASLTMYFLDQKTNADFVQDGIWTDGDGASTFGTYDTAATLSDNTLCINVSKWDQATVRGNIDSKGDKYSFDPSEPQIAHIIAGEQIVKYECKSSCGNIVLGTSQQQGAGTCTNFDNETNAGYCTNTAHSNNFLIIQNSAGFEVGATYQVELRILVNGSYGDYGVYFTASPVGLGVTSDVNQVCNPLAVTQSPAASYWNAAGSSVTAANTTTPCTVPTAARATRLLTDGNTAIVSANGTRYMYIDIPTFQYDLSLVNEGDMVEVEFSLLKAPCGTLISGTHCIGIMGCEAVASFRTLLYPYFTQMDDDPAADGFWDGFVITNIGSTDGSADVTVYEADGDVGEITVQIEANSMYVNTLNAMLASMNQTDGAGTLGDARAYIVVCADVNVDGFGFMGASLDNPFTGMSIGYLPRNAPNLSVSTLCQ